MMASNTKRKKENPRKQNFIVTLVKDMEFIIVRFARRDYGLLNRKLIREVYIQPYIKDGWTLLDIEVFYSDSWTDY